jgi:hypothetical protein
VDVGRSLVQDRKREATHVVPAGEGDRGDQQPRSRTTRSRSGSAPARPRSGRTAAQPKARTCARGTAAKRSRRR